MNGTNGVIDTAASGANLVFMRASEDHITEGDDIRAVKRTRIVLSANLSGAAYYGLFANEKEANLVPAGSLCKFTVYSFVRNYAPAKRWMNDAQLAAMEDSFFSPLGLSGLALAM